MKYLFLISGKLQSGKNQFAEYISEYLQENCIHVGEDLFAKGVKDGCRDDFKKFTECLNDKLYDIKQSLYDIDTPDMLIMNSIITQLDNLRIYEDNWYEEKTDLTRILLQLYGTEIFRNRVDQEHWPKQLCKRCMESDAEVILITDVRFENEVDLVKELGELDSEIKVVSIRIERPMERTEDFNEHPSETALDNYNNWDYVVTNDGSLEMLEACAHQIVEEVYIPK